MRTNTELNPRSRPKPRHLIREKVVMEVTVQLEYTDERNRNLALASARECLCNTAHSSDSCGGGGSFSMRPTLARLKAGHEGGSKILLKQGRLK